MKTAKRPPSRSTPPLLVALPSAVLLLFAFPNFNQPWCAWLALVPWLLSLRDQTPRQAFRSSYVVGLVFFFGSIWWLIHVTVVGWLLLCAYLALFFGVFGWLANRCGSRLQAPGSRLCVIPSAWVACEYLRSHLLSGFGWNLLGYSQAPVLPLIQMADVTGVWGVSWMVVLVNVALAEAVGRRPHHPRPSLLPLVLAVFGVVAMWGYGRVKLRAPESARRMRVAVVQGNIPQIEKWDEAFLQSILQRYGRLTHQIAKESPQLIVWPETSVPGYLGFDELLTTWMAQLARSVHTPLLVGAPMGTSVEGLWRITNSAALLDPLGEIVMRYDKLHLVPFGEFVPLDAQLPWLRRLLPPIGDFVPGHDYTVFTVPIRNSEFGIRNVDSALRTPHSTLRFSVLICFEDIFPDLARAFVRRGARMLITITNDAWFGKTAAAYQHAQASTFRAVELRVPMVRAANTGWSGCIDASGRWLASVHDAKGEELFVEGTALCDVPLGETGPDVDGAGSVYRRFGDWFAWLCLGGCLGWAIFAIMTP